MNFLFVSILVKGFKILSFLSEKKSQEAKIHCRMEILFSVQ